MQKLKLGPKARLPLTLRMAKVFADSLRIKILAECNTREMSPKEFQAEFGGGSLSRVSRAFDVLVEYGWLIQSRTETGGERRGGVEHFYVATGLAMFDESTWPDLPEPLQNVFTWRAFITFAQAVKEALMGGTLDARKDRHFTWSPLRLDLRGWKTVIAKIDALFFFIFEEQKRANVRMAKSGEEPIPMIVGLMAFESPKDAEKQP